LLTLHYAIADFHCRAFRRFAYLPTLLLMMYFAAAAAPKLRLFD